MRDGVSWTDGEVRTFLLKDDYRKVTEDSKNRAGHRLWRWSSKMSSRPQAGDSSRDSATVGKGATVHLREKEKTSEQRGPRHGTCPTGGQ